VTSWLDEEAGLVSAWRELGRLRRRAASRPIHTLGITLLITFAVVYKSSRSVPAFESRVVFRVVEADIEAQTSLVPNHALRSYINDVVFSSERLVELMKRHKLGGSKVTKDPAEAVKGFREDLIVEVWRNYFMEARSTMDPARSARVAISYPHKDAKLAYEVTRDLGDLVVKTQEEERIARAEETVRALADIEDAAQEELDKARSAIAVKELALSSANAAEQAVLRIELAALRAGLKPLEDRVARIAAARGDYALRADLEREQLGLRFEVVEAPRVMHATVSRPKKLIKIGVATFFVILLLVGIAVGAFDSRVHDVEDVRRLGWEPLGHVRAFDGDGVGSLNERLRRADDDEVD
jgi:hypothetical protein